MESKVSNPPWSIEFNKRLPIVIETWDVNTYIYIDNTGTPAPTFTTSPFWRISTGALGINKSTEFLRVCRATGDVSPVDCYCIATDPDFAGFWRRIHKLTCTVKVQGTAGTLAADTYAGIEIGTYGAGAPWPVTTPNNVVRLVARPLTSDFALIVHPGDGVSAANIIPISYPLVTNKMHKFTILVNPGQYVSAAIDDVVRATSSIIPVVGNPLPSGSAAGTFGIFCSSGNSSCNIRGAFGPLTSETWGM